MCVVSMISAYGQQMEPHWWTHERFKEFTKLRKYAEHFDEVTGQPHCEEPQKEAWFQQLMKRLDTIEKKLDEKGENGASV